jgi:hypothetical protein
VGDGGGAVAFSVYCGRAQKVQAADDGGPHEQEEDPHADEEVVLVMLSLPLRRAAHLELLEARWLAPWARPSVSRVVRSFFCRFSGMIILFCCYCTSRQALLAYFRQAFFNVIF